jgi:hypothetical protein
VKLGNSKLAGQRGYGSLQPIQDGFHGYYVFSGEEMTPKAVLSWKQAGELFPGSDVQFDIFKQNTGFDDEIVLMEFDLFGSQKLICASIKCLHEDVNYCNCLYWRGSVTGDGGSWCYMEPKTK